jgi:DNA-binding NarL/FixJ family response regulator
MPGKSGFDILCELHEVNPQARLVMMTGKVMAGLASEAIRIGVDGVLYKSFDLRSWWMR